MMIRPRRYIFIRDCSSLIVLSALIDQEQESNNEAETTVDSKRHYSTLSFAIRRRSENLTPTQQASKSGSPCTLTFFDIETTVPIPKYR